MGFLDSLSSVLDRVIPTGLSFVTGGPAAAISTAAGIEQAKKNEKIMERAEFMYNQDPGLTQGFSGVSQRGLTPVNPGGFFGGLGSTIGGFGRDIGQFFQDVSPLTSLFGIDNPATRTNSGTATTIIRQAPDETASSGEILGANLGLGTGLIQGAGRLLSGRGTQTGLGFAGGVAGALLSGDSSSAPRITRKMKSDVRRIYMMAGMDPAVTAQILNSMGTYPRINFNASMVFFILTKRFRNDGPVVTKAAVRKTKTTLRRMKNVADMYNSVCKPTTRRAPARRAPAKAVQLIKN